MVPPVLRVLLVLQVLMVPRVLMVPLDPPVLRALKVIKA
jgi:hypothetical protein